MREKIKEAWRELYLGEFPESYEEAKEHSSGDLLADYLAVEFEEGTEENDGNDIERMIVVAEKAIEDLQTFLGALESRLEETR